MPTKAQRALSLSLLSLTHSWSSECCAHKTPCASAAADCQPAPVSCIMSRERTSERVAARLVAAVLIALVSPTPPPLLLLYVVVFRTVLSGALNFFKSVAKPFVSSIEGVCCRVVCEQGLKVGGRGPPFGNPRWCDLLMTTWDCDFKEQFNEFNRQAG
jgi:hypothetical protein